MTGEGGGERLCNLSSDGDRIIKMEEKQQLHKGLFSGTFPLCLDGSHFFAKHLNFAFLSKKQ